MAHFCWFFFGFFSLAFFMLNRKPCFSPLKGHFLFSLSVFLFFSLAFSGLPLFHFLFLFLTLFLVLSSFLFVFFLLSFGLLFLSLSFFLFVSSLFHEKNNIKIFNYKVFSSILSHFCCFPLFFFLSNPLSLSLIFS